MGQPCDLHAGRRDAVGDVMRKSVFALLTGISLAAVAPAQAATFTNGDYSLNFHGISESYSLYPDPVPGLAATLDLTVSGAGTDSWTLVYKLSNLSDPSIWEKTRKIGRASCRERVCQYV